MIRGRGQKDKKAKKKKKGWQQKNKKWKKIVDKETIYEKERYKSRITFEPNLYLHNPGKNKHSPGANPIKCKKFYRIGPWYTGAQRMNEHQQTFVERSKNLNNP